MPWSRVGSLLISNFGDPQITVADLQELIARGDTFNDKLLYSSANLHGTAQYWHQRRILQTKGKEVNLAEDSNAPFKVIQENTHVVTSYFDLRNQAYHDKVLKPVFGVSGCFYCYEFAKFRGQIHWHQLSWRGDRRPHQLFHEAREDGCEEEECAVRLSGQMKPLP